MIRLIVGLGNPTPAYEKTRHNAGFWFLDALIRREGGHFRQESGFLGELARDSRPGGHAVLLLKPATYMNRSGGSVAAVLSYFKIAAQEMLVVHDDLDLSPGDVRLKRAGGHGGHNGLRDIIRATGTADFLRLRLGIGHPGDRSRVADFVLDAPGRSDREQVDAAIDAGLEALIPLLEGGEALVMNRLNGRQRNHSTGHSS